MAVDRCNEARAVLCMLTYVSKHSVSRPWKCYLQGNRATKAYPGNEVLSFCRHRRFCGEGVRATLDPREGISASGLAEYGKKKKNVHAKTHRVEKGDARGWTKGFEFDKQDYSCIREGSDCLR